MMAKKAQMEADLADLRDMLTRMKDFRAHWQMTITKLPAFDRGLKTSIDCLTALLEIVDDRRWWRD